MKAIRVHGHGGPEVLSYENVTLPDPKPTEVRIRNRAIGVNFTDIYFRTGFYTPPSLPFTPGNEGAGEVVAVGSEVTDFAIGDRVAYVNILGGYAEESIVPARLVVHLPAEMTFETGAAAMLKGLTAQYLLHRTVTVKAGDVLLVHAAAGGVGSLLVQWAKYLGAHVIGTVGSPEKAQLAKQNGCDYVIEYRREDIAKRVNEITNGKGCHVVYDSVGKVTFSDSINSLRPLGHLVSYGTASGPVEPVKLSLLAQRGSLTITSPVLFDYLQEREDMVTMSNQLFDVVIKGIVEIPVRMRLPLSQAAKAHAELEARATTGMTILLP